MKIVHKNITPEIPKTTEVQDEEKTLYDVLNKIPQPRKHFVLNEKQKVLRYWFGAQFLKTREFTELDLPHLQRAAFWLDARNMAIAKINEKGYDGGLVQTFTSNATNVSGHVTIVEKADKHLDDVSAHFGLSFKDRKKLAMEKSDPAQLDMFTQFLNAAQ